MAHDPDPAHERRRRLDEVRAEIERDLAAGSTIDPAAWPRRHPGLEPELGALVAELAAGRPPIGAGGSSPAIDVGWSTRVRLGSQDSPFG